MKNILLLICLTLFSCKTETEPITKEYLLGKKFVKPALMGGLVLKFIDDEKVKFSIHDKRSYGYGGTYTLENKGEKQYIKITNIEKFGNICDWQDALKGYDKDYVMIEVLNSKEVKMGYSGEVLELWEKENSN